METFTKTDMIEFAKYTQGSRLSTTEQDFNYWVKFIGYRNGIKQLANELLEFDMTIDSANDRDKIAQLTKRLIDINNGIHNRLSLSTQSGG